MSSSLSETCKTNIATHTFNISIATQLKSADQAIFLHHINYWIEYNQRAEKNLHDGRYWTYQTLEELHGHFPYWTKDQLRNIIGKLVARGILIKGNFNQNKYDHTIWYSIDWSKIPTSICEISHIEKVEIPDRNGGNPTPIPNNKTKNETKDYIGISSRKELKLFKESVYLTQNEYDKLVKEHGEKKLNIMLDKLDSHIIAKGDKYKNHYGVLKKGGWCDEAAEKILGDPKLVNVNDLRTNCLKYFKENNSDSCNVTVTDTAVIFYDTGANGHQVTVRFDEGGAKEQIKNEVSKRRFYKYKEKS